MIIKAKIAHEKIVESKKRHEEKIQRIAEKYFKEHLVAIEKHFNKCVNKAINSENYGCYVYFDYPDPILKSSYQFRNAFGELLIKHASKFGYISKRPNYNEFGINFDTMSEPEPKDLKVQ